MTRKNTAVLILLLFLCAVGLFIPLCSALKAEFISNDLPVNSKTTASPFIAPKAPLPSMFISPSPAPINKKDEPDATKPFATLTIQTDRKTRTFNIYPDVNEATLNQHIGHLPASADPGDSGLCVLMGHRDKALRLLKDAKIGHLIHVKKDGIDYAYKIHRIEVQNNADPLSFYSTSESEIAIVTCYPFDFLGPAPKRIIFYCKRK